MADIFVHSGEDNASVVAPTPRLQGIFIPGIDTPDMQDGFGLITPFGGGVTERQYTQYGISDIKSPQETQLHNLASIPAEGQTFNFEGLVGPQGIPGPPGSPGIIQIIYGPNSNFLAALPHNIDQINDLGTMANKLIYTNGYTSIYDYDFTWTKTDIAEKMDWYDIDLNIDGTFFLVIESGGVYISTDKGDSWTDVSPGEIDYSYSGGSCPGTVGKAVLRGWTDESQSIVWTTINYGVNWTEKTVVAPDVLP